MNLLALLAEVDMLPPQVMCVVLVRDPTSAPGS